MTTCKLNASDVSTVTVFLPICWKRRFGWWGGWLVVVLFVLFYFNHYCFLPNKSGKLWSMCKPLIQVSTQLWTLSYIWYLTHGFPNQQCQGNHLVILAVSGMPKFCIQTGNFILCPWDTISFHLLVKNSLLGGVVVLSSVIVSSAARFLASPQNTYKIHPVSHVTSCFSITLGLYRWRVWTISIFTQAVSAVISRKLLHC